MAKTKIFCKPKNIYFRKEIDGRVTILRFDDDQNFYTLEGISADFWLLLDGRSNIEDVKTKLQKKHSAAKIQFDRKFNALVRDLSKEKLVAEVP